MGIRTQASLFLSTCNLLQHFSILHLIFCVCSEDVLDDAKIELLLMKKEEERAAIQLIFEGTKCWHVFCAFLLNAGSQNKFEPFFFLLLIELILTK